MVLIFYVLWLLDHLRVWVYRSLGILVNVRWQGSVYWLWEHISIGRRNAYHSFSGTEECLHGSIIGCFVNVFSQYWLGMRMWVRKIMAYHGLELVFFITICPVYDRMSLERS